MSKRSFWQKFRHLARLFFCESHWLHRLQNDLTQLRRTSSTQSSEILYFKRVSQLSFHCSTCRNLLWLSVCGMIEQSFRLLIILVTEQPSYSANNIQMRLLPLNHTKKKMPLSIIFTSEIVPPIEWALDDLILNRYGWLWLGSLRILFLSLMKGLWTTLREGWPLKALNQALGRAFDI